MGYQRRIHGDCQSITGSTQRANLLINFDMSTQHYAAFIKLTKKDVVECKKMPKPLAECFPTAKVASIATRGWAGKLKLKKRGNKGKVTYKPRKCLLPRVSNKKRQSSDKKLNGDQSPTKRSESRIDFDGTAKVESTKTARTRRRRSRRRPLHNLVPSFAKNKLNPPPLTPPTFVNALLKWLQLV